MEIKKYAAIDIGSNAIRLLIANVITNNYSEPLIKKSSLVRVPIRLGADVFVKGNISDENKNRMIDAMNAFQLLMNVHGVEKYRACATSAMREAINGPTVIAEIFDKTGIQIEMIDGKTEAEIIFSSDLADVIQENKSYLYVDVGGGSTEFTVFSNGKLINSKSFKMGTVRLINKMVNKKEIWPEIKNWIKENTNGLRKVTVIGSGGNINKIFKMSGRAPGKSLSYIYLSSQFHSLKQMSYDQRITELSLNPDRADVIIPATKIYLNAMKWSKSNKLIVPKIGLSDGIIKSLFNSKNE